MWFVLIVLACQGFNKSQGLVVRPFPIKLRCSQHNCSYNPVPRRRLQQIVSPLFAGIPDRVEAHELSSVFTILALGALMDAPMPPDQPIVDRYANYGKLCLSLECIFGQTSVATIEANLLRLIFLLFSRDRTAPMKVFAQLGLIGRLIISMGMRKPPLSS